MKKIATHYPPRRQFAVDLHRAFQLADYRQFHPLRHLCRPQVQRRLVASELTPHNSPIGFALVRHEKPLPDKWRETMAKNAKAPKPEVSVQEDQKTGDCRLQGLWHGLEMPRLPIRSREDVQARG
jgi:hypothetical protein